MLSINLMRGELFSLERQVTVTLAGQSFWSAESGRQKEMIKMESVRLVLSVASSAIVGERVAVALGLVHHNVDWFECGSN